MKDLQQRVEKMLQGEKKRKEVARKWLEEVERIVAKVGKNIWGDERDGVRSDPIFLWTEENGKRRTSDVYLRYRDSGYREIYYWDEPVGEKSGTDFWYAIRQTLEWLPLLQKEIEERETSRNRLVEKLSRMLDAV